MPQASIPPTIGFAAAPAVAALLAQEVPEPPAPANVDTNLTTMEFGRIPVNVLLTRSLFAVRCTRPFGVTRQEQQEINCSSGENA